MRLLIVTLALTVAAITGVLVYRAPAAEASWCSDAPLYWSATYMHDANLRHGVYCSGTPGDRTGDNDIVIYQREHPGWVFYAFRGDAWHPHGNPRVVKESLWFARNFPSGTAYQRVVSWASGTDRSFNDGIYVP